MATAAIACPSTAFEQGYSTFTPASASSFAVRPMTPVSFGTTV
jgi:hypothetical protein